jgi:hypothetical protein
MAPVIDELVHVKSWWNDTDERKPKYLKKKPCPKCHSVRHKSHLDWPGVEPGPPR